MSGKLIPCAVAAVCSVVTAVLISHAGPLDPPAGPVTSNYKTLTEVEPRIAVNSSNTPGDANSIFVISKPGSYYLTGDIDGVVGKNGISITSSDVTLDLAGFRLNGVGGSLRGIIGTNVRIAVRNGNISNWGSEGLLLSLQCTAESIRAASNGGDGISLGALGTVTDCSVIGGSGRGIVAGIVSEVRHSAVGAVAGNGIEVSQSVVTDCCVNNCTVGISVSGSSTVLNCNLQVNKGDGIRATSSGLIRGNLCSSNGNTLPDGAGIRVTGVDTRIESNNCTGNRSGIRIEGNGNIVLGNTCSSNSVNNYDIAVNNRYGPIINITASGTAAAVGNSATSTLTSTDPWANFAY